MPFIRYIIDYAYVVVPVGSCVTLLVFGILPDFCIYSTSLCLHNVAVIGHLPTFLSISDICDVRPLVKVHFNTCCFLLNQPWRLDQSNVINVVITVISAYGPHLQYPYRKCIPISISLKRNKASIKYCNLACIRALASSDVPFHDGFQTV